MTVVERYRETHDEYTKTYEGKPKIGRQKSVDIKEFYHWYHTAIPEIWSI